jgi:hypothetical protein
MWCCVGGELPTPPTLHCVSSTCVSSTCVSSTCVSSTCVSYTCVSYTCVSPTFVSYTYASSSCVSSSCVSYTRVSSIYVSSPCVSVRISPTLSLSLSPLFPSHHTISTMQLSSLIRYLDYSSYSPLQYDTFHTIKNLT